MRANDPLLEWSWTDNRHEVLATLADRNWNWGHSSPLPILHFPFLSPSRYSTDCQRSMGPRLGWVQLHVVFSNFDTVQFIINKIVGFVAAPTKGLNVRMFYATFPVLLIPAGRPTVLYLNAVQRANNSKLDLPDIVTLCPVTPLIDVNWW